MEKLRKASNDIERSKILNESMKQAQVAQVAGTTLPALYLKFVDAVDSFEIRDDDIFVCSYPKAGTTWTQEMVWCISNDLDFEAAKVDLYERFPFLEDFTLAGSGGSLTNGKAGEHGFPENSLKLCENLQSPRFIKTHLPFHLLPRELREGKKKTKIIYVQRNPKDTCISYYHHSELLGFYEGAFELFCELFLADKVSSPFWGHRFGYWSQRTNPDLQILYLNYEEMKADLPSVIRRTSEFLGKPILSTEKLEELVDHLSFSNMRNNSSVNREKWINIIEKNNSAKVNRKFLRCGQVDQWRSDMTPEMIKRFDEWTEKNIKSFDSIIQK